jgi:hypothetical protein
MLPAPLFYTKLYKYLFQYFSLKSLLLTTAEAINRESQASYRRINRKSVA